MLKKVLSVLLLCITLNAPLPHAAAEIHTLTASGEYEFTVDVDSPVTAREMARERARQSAVEMTGVYVKACTENKNFHVTLDKIKVIAASTLEIINEDIRMQPSADNKSIRILCTIQAKVDTDRIDLQRIAVEEKNLEKLAQQNQHIQDLEKETNALKAMNATLQEQVQREQIQSQILAKERQYRIARYERDIDIYNFGGTHDPHQQLETAQKLIELDPQNTTAFRFMLAYYRHQNTLDKIKTYCQQVIDGNYSDEMKLNAYVQLSDLSDDNLARSYINQGIALAQTRYSPAEIENLVNGDNVMLFDNTLTGRSNVIRELYVKKNDLEKYPPMFNMDTHIQTLYVTGSKIYNIHYKTNWATAPDFPKTDHNPSSTPIKVTGMGKAPKNSLLPVTFAKQAAILDVYSQLVAMTKGFTVDSPTDIEQLILADDLDTHIKLEAEDVLKIYNCFTISNINYTKDNWLELEVEANLS